MKEKKVSMLQRCRRCTMPITQDTIYFDDKGVCNICRGWEKKLGKMDWKDKEKKLLNMFKWARNRKAPYDCIVPFSGGKDSTFTLWAVAKKYGMKTLVVSFDHCFFRPKTIENRIRTFRKLGVDVLTFTPNWRIVKKLMLESLIRKGDFCWHCHVGIYAYPMKIATFYKIPLVIWGETSSEYATYYDYGELENSDERKFNRFINLGMRAEDMAGFIGADLRDLDPFIYPSLEEIKAAGIKSVQFGSFVKWDVRKHVRTIKKELGWKEDEVESAFPGLTYEKIECMFTGMRDFIKYLKRGFARITHLTTLDIRHKRIGRSRAMKLIKQYEGKKPASLGIFLEYMGLNEQEFYDIVFRHVIYPNQPVDIRKLKNGKMLWDQDLWYRERDAG